MISDDKFKKIMNLIFNFSMIMGGVMMSSMGQALGAMAQAMSEGIEETMAEIADPKGKKAIKKKLPAKEEISANIRKMTKDIPQQMQALRPQLEANKDKIKKVLTEKFCDQGLKINSKYKFKFDQQLSGEETANYFTLALQNDPEFSKMFQELAAWMETAPQELKSVMGQN